MELQCHLPTDLFSQTKKCRPAMRNVTDHKIRVSLPMVGRELPITQTRHFLEPSSSYRPTFTCHNALNDTQTEEEQEAALDVSLSSMSATERRKWRAARRSVKNKESERNEAYELSAAMDKEIKTPREDLFKLEHLKRLGEQWYMVHVVASEEESTMTGIREMMAERFPGVEYELFYPAIKACVHPTAKNPSPVTKLEPGAIFVRVTMSREQYSGIRSVFRVREIIGRQYKRGSILVTIPEPISLSRILEMKRLVEEGNKRYDEWKGTEAKEVLKESEPSVKEEPKVSKPNIRPLLTPGRQIKVIKGPYRNFKGAVDHVVPRKRRVVANILVLDRTVSMELSVDQIELFDGTMEL